jgi:hypothetical protein
LEGKEDSRKDCLGVVRGAESGGGGGGGGGTYQRKFGGVLRALKMMNWRIGVKSIVYAA